MIAIALLIAAQSVSAGESHGPFAIETSLIEQVGAPYPVDIKTTTLKWKAKSGLAAYELSDTGHEITSRFELGPEPRFCWGMTRLRRLEVKPPEKFGEDMLGGGCPHLTPEQTRILRADIVSARRHFARSYDAFFRRTIAQHGPSMLRCRETVRGNHGPDCIAYWDEGREAPAQSNNKRR